MRSKILTAMLALSPLAAWPSEGAEGFLLCEVKRQVVELIDDGVGEIFGTDISVNPDWISISDSTSEVMLKRYYKDDWEGVFIYTGFAKVIGAHVATFDCRTRGDSIPDLVSAMAAASGH